MAQAGGYFESTTERKIYANVPVEYQQRVAIYSLREVCDKRNACSILEFIIVVVKVVILDAVPSSHWRRLFERI